MHKCLKFIKLLFLILTSAVFSSVGQESINHWETVLFPDVVFSFFTNNMGTADANWRNPEYDDSAWPTGKGGLGYGDGDDSTILAPPLISVFMRTSFLIYDTSEISSVILNIDYDDAFVAYINGTEVARSAGLTGDFPGSNQLSGVQHEAVMYQGAIPDYIRINKDKISGVLKAGKNIFSMQVHNVSASSSDLSSLVYFSVGMSSSRHIYQTPPDWFKPPVEFTSSNLPVFVIETENHAPIPDEPKIKAHLGIIYGGPDSINHITDPFTEYDGVIGIEIRGNSTSTWPKKPYGFETRTETGENLNVSLLGLPEENDWVLRASYYDRSFVRNPLAHHMSEEAGHWSSGNKYCELVLNGQYQGIYILVEKIKRTKNRLNLEKLKPNQLSPEEITGAYIYEIEGQYNDFGESRRLKYPKIDSVAPDQLAYIRKYDDDFRAESQSDYSADPLAFYNRWIDLRSFIDYLLVIEAMRNPDGYGWSSFYFKDRNKLLNAGPVWDFDQAAGNSTLSEGWRTDKWLIDYQLWPIPPYWSVFLNEPYFQYQLKIRWEELRADKFKDENLMAFIDSCANILSSEAAFRNFQTWPVLNAPFWRELDGFEELDTYQKHIDFLKNWLHERWIWMDQELSQIPDYVGTSLPQRNIALTLFPIPSRTNFFIESETGINQIEFMDLSGKIRISKTLQAEQSFLLNVEEFAPGYYLIRVSLSNGEQKILKVIIQ